MIHKPQRTAPLAVATLTLSLFSAGTLGAAGPANAATTATATTAVATAVATASSSAAAALALTPPMGFNDWNAFGCGVSESLIKETADFFVSSGLKAAGYQYVNIDDCWASGARRSRGCGPPTSATSGAPPGTSATTGRACARTSRRT